MKSPLQPELLAPAGNWDCVRAALAHGADAVYFGLEQFNARMRADNFRLEELPLLMTYLHRHGARGYVTMNILLFPNEIDQACRYLQALDEAGVDAVIVQDMGLAAYIAQLKKDKKLSLELHLSTQMTISSPEAVRWVDEQFDPEQIVLARELSLEDIAACAAVTEKPLEVFCHGALCVAYSGQCLTSESLGQRSANRGECAQACRMPYTLEVDGRMRYMAETRYLFSPQDLCSLEIIPDMLAAGVRSFKIEGRLKNPLYVAATTRAYRAALDAATGKRRYRPAEMENNLYAMQMTFSRGFYTGWLGERNHAALTHGKFGKKRGALVGRIGRIGRSAIELEEAPSIPIANGDGFVLDAGEDRNEEQGGRIWKSEMEGQQLFFHGKASHIDWSRVEEGQLVWKTSDPSLDKSLQQSWADFQRPPQKAVQAGNSLDIHISGMIGSPLQLSCRGISVRSMQALQEAQKQALSPESIEKQLSRLGDTDYTLGNCTYSIPKNAMLPISQLNALRRELIEKLQTMPQQKIVTMPRPRLPRPSLSWLAPSAAKRVKLHALCRNKDQAIALAQQGTVERLYLDLTRLEDIVPLIKELRAIAPQLPIWVATLRIMKAGENSYTNLYKNCGADGILVRHMGYIPSLKAAGLPMVGDFSLNCANALSAQFWKQRGLDSCCISYDLNATQVKDMLLSGCAPFMELTLHQHMPLFHMEHCLFCAYLSQGKNFRDCGRPCDYHTVRVRDRVGKMHYLYSDEGCRNTLFQEEAQTAIRHVLGFQQLGLEQVRVDLLHENPTDAKWLLETYNNILINNGRADHLIRRIDARDRLGLCHDEKK